MQHNTHFTNRQHGYSLLELLLYISLVGILLGATSVFFGVVADARIKSQSINEVEQQGSIAMEYITSSVRNASSITLPLSATTGSVLTVATATTATNPTIVSVIGNVLQTQEGALATAINLTNNNVQVTNLTIKNLSPNSTPGTVQISLTLARVNQSGRNEYDFQKTFISSATVRQRP